MNNIHIFFEEKLHQTRSDVRAVVMQQNFRLGPGAGDGGGGGG